MSENQLQTPPPIYVVSGGKGLAGDAVVNSILIQFPNHQIPIIIKPDVLSDTDIQEVIDEAMNSQGVIVHTMVDPEMRKKLVIACIQNNVRNFDLVGDLSDYLSVLLKKQPISKPGLYRLNNIEYFQRVEAIEFTLKYDDGQFADKIENADIVLTGVSRTGKTPLSVYLAMFGWKVANVPLVPGIDPPESLFKVDKNRVFGLTISVRYLIAQRGNRIRRLDLNDQIDYVDPQMVRRELEYSEAIFRKGDFTVINITNKPIESSANEILTIFTDRIGREDWKRKQTI